MGNNGQYLKPHEYLASVIHQKQSGNPEKWSLRAISKRTSSVAGTTISPGDLSKLTRGLLPIGPKRARILARVLKCSERKLWSLEGAGK